VAGERSVLGLLFSRVTMNSSPQRKPGTEPGFSLTIYAIIDDFDAPKGPRAHTMSPPLQG